MTKEEGIKTESEIKVESDMADDFENFQGMHTTISIVPTSSASDTAPQMTRPLISVKDFRIPSASPGGVVSSSTSSPPGSACMRPPPPPGPPRPSRNVGYVEVKQERLDRERHPHEEPSSSIPDLGKSLRCFVGTATLPRSLAASPRNVLLRHFRPLSGRPLSPPPTPPHCYSPRILPTVSLGWNADTLPGKRSTSL